MSDSKHHPAKKAEFVYLVVAIDAKPEVRNNHLCWHVKIGASGDIHKRLGSLSTGNHSRLVCYAKEVGGLRREASRKKEFEKWHTRREWFLLPRYEMQRLVEEMTVCDPPICSDGETVPNWSKWMAKITKLTTTRAPDQAAEDKGKNLENQDEKQLESIIAPLKNMSQNFIQVLDECVNNCPFCVDTEQFLRSIPRYQGAEMNLTLANGLINRLDGHLVSLKTHLRTKFRNHPKFQHWTDTVTMAEKQRTNQDNRCFQVIQLMNVSFIQQYTEGRDPRLNFFKSEVKRDPDASCSIWAMFDAYREWVTEAKADEPCLSTIDFVNKAREYFGARHIVYDTATSEIDCRGICLKRQIFRLGKRKSEEINKPIDLAKRTRFQIDSP